LTARDFVLVLVATILFGVAAVGLDRTSRRAGALDLGASCRPFAAAWLDDRGATLPWSEPTRLDADGALLACVPSTEVLRFSMRGDVALGRGAHAVVVHAGETVWNGLVAEPTSLELRVAAGDAVLIAFTNDIYRSPGEDRGLWISAVDSEPR
jgi:hypothetical protein